VKTLAAIQAIQAIRDLCEEENLKGTLQVRAEFWEEKYLEEGECAPIAVGSSGGKIQVRRLRRGKDLFRA
jgi:hypothetical protein